MLDVIGGLMVAVMVLLFLIVLVAVGIFIGNIIYRLKYGAYVNPAKVRICKDIDDSYL